MPGDIPFLTDLQLAIMDVLWTKDQATVADITEALRSERGLAQTTVATMVSRLERRGLVTHVAQARQFVYRPLISRPDAERSMVAEFTDRLFGGDPALLVNHLLTGRQFSRGDLARVKALIEQHEGGKGKGR